MKKVQGFVMNFGYVESSQTSKVVIRHLGDGFDTIEEAVSNLAHYLLENVPWIETVDELEGYFYSIPSQVASAGLSEITWDREHCNGEEWWPWFQVYELYELLPYFYENDLYCMSSILIRYLDPEKVKNDSLRQELIELGNSLDPYLWELEKVMVKVVE